MRRLKYGLVLVLAAALGVLLAVGVNQVGELRQRADRGSVDRADLRAVMVAQGERIAEQEKALDRANRRLVAAGKDPVGGEGSFSFTVPGSPAQTYRVTCTQEGCTVERTER